MSFILCPTHLNLPAAKEQVSLDQKAMEEANRLVLKTVRRDGTVDWVGKTTFPDGWSYETMVEAGRKMTDDIAGGTAQWLNPRIYRKLTKGRDNVFVTDFNGEKIIGYKNIDGSLNSWFPLFGDLSNYN